MLQWSCEPKDEEERQKRINTWEVGGNKSLKKSVSSEPKWIVPIFMVVTKEMKEQDEERFHVQVFAQVLIGLHVRLTRRMELWQRHHQIVKNANLKGGEKVDEH